MHKRNRPDEEHKTIIKIGFRFYRETALTERDRFPLVRTPIHYDQRSDRRVDEMRASHIAETKEKTVAAIPKTDNGVVTEHQRVRSMLRSGELREDQSGHERLDEDPTTCLNHQEQNPMGTMWLDHTRPVPNRVLGLHREQESGEKVVNPGNARLPSGAVWGEVIPVSHGYRPPADGEHTPASHKSNPKHNEVVTPFHVDQRGKYVLQVASITLQYISC